MDPTRDHDSTQQTGTAAADLDRLIAALREPAPVYAPRSWPNSSFSTRPSGIAAQFSAIKECSRLGER